MLLSNVVCVCVRDTCEADFWLPVVSMKRMHFSMKTGMGLSGLTTVDSGNPK